MSEVHRYQVVKMLSEEGNKIAYDPHGPWIVMARDFDRVTAERDAALAELAEQRLFLSHEVLANDHLQQRLTAADERADVLEGLLANAYETAAKWVEKRMDDYVNEHGSEDPETGSLELPGTGDEYVCELMEIADGLRALKPAEGADHE